MARHVIRIISSGLLPAFLAAGAPMLARAADSDRATSLEEIVVTTQKRSENLQSVPLSLSGFTAAALEDRHINNLQDLRLAVPSLLYYTGTAGVPQYYIRGLGNDARGGAQDGAVGVFMDGVYLGNPTMTSFDYVDLEKVEVLRGPQGTLFGRNVLAGAISYTTRKPTNVPRMGAEVTYGNYNTIGMKAYASGPITDKFYVGFAASGHSHDGYNFNTTTNQDTDTERTFGGHVILRFVPTDDLDIQFISDVSRRRGDGGWSILYNAGKEPTAKSEIATPRRDAHYTDDGYLNFDNNGFSVDVDWTTGIGKFTSISSYRDSWRHVRNISTPPNVPSVFDPTLVVGQLSNILYNQGGYESTRQKSQEFRLASPDGERLKWVFGLYYYHQDDSYNPTLEYEFFNFREQGNSGVFQGSHTNAYAAYGNASYDILSNLTFQVGVRWSRDKKTARSIAYGINYVPWLTNGAKTPNGYDVTGSAAWDATTPSFSLNYEPVEGKHLYATVSKGFESGAFYAPLQEALAAQAAVNPEFVWNYEVGAKTEWLDKHLRLNVTGYWENYSNLQVNAIQALSNGLSEHVILNAGKTTSKGIEGELNVVVTQGLTLHTSYSYMTTRINTTSAAAAATLHVGDQLIRAPHHKLDLGGSYSMPLMGSISATTNIDYSYMSGYYGSLPNDPIAYSPATKQLSAGLLLDNGDGHWSLEFWGKNLTDQILPYTVTPISGFGYYSALDPPRTFGVTIHYKN